MAWLVHLSDLHLFGGDASEQTTILRSLVQALRAERSRREAPADLLCITGDVFNSATVPAVRATRGFRRLLEEIHDALGGSVPTVIIPGNHDRRRDGVYLPYDEMLFDSLRDALRGRAWVQGAGKPFLAEVVPPDVHQLPLWLVAYDSNHLPNGALGAGGAIRQEDLLRAAAIIDGHQPGWPVLFLLHHHLIPTPLTDLGPIELEGSSKPVRWLVEHGLPRILANADREELFMTALGAGTALSTLHAMGRAVVVLHGHKHYATSRLLKATRTGQGDVLIVSAGSGGVAQTWRDGAAKESARLWPSFNAITLGDRALTVEQVAFSWRDPSADLARRPLVAVERADTRFLAIDLDEQSEEPGPRMEENRAAVVLGPSLGNGAHRWDATYDRAVRFAPGSEGERYVESVMLPHGSDLVRLSGAASNGEPIDGSAELTLDPRGASYVVRGAIARTAREERRSVGRHATPFGRVQLMNRYQSRLATLSLRGLGERSATAFGSVTDLGTGLERPANVEVDGDLVTLQVTDCPPRSLLRIYWLLEDPRVSGSLGYVPPPAARQRLAPEPRALVRAPAARPARRRRPRTVRVDVVD